MSKVNRRKFIKGAVYSTIATIPAITVLDSLFIKKENNLTRITILHTNDLHSHIDPFPANHSRFPNMGGVSARYNLIQKIRKEKGKKSVLLFDSGDIMQGTPYFNYFNGQVEFEAMNKMKYDAATIGNHDFDGGILNLKDRIEQASFPFVISNYNFKNTILNQHTQKFKIFKKRGIKIGVFGIGIELKGLVDKNLYKKTEYINPIKTANKMAELLKYEEKCNYIICLSHLGFKYKSNKISDLELSKNTKNINLILGGHTHTFLNKPYVAENLENKNTLINQAGWAGVTLGHLDLFFDKKKKIKNINFKSNKIKN